MEQILLETVLRDLEHKGVIGDHQKNFSRGKLCLTHCAFNNAVTPLVDEGNSTDVIYLDLCKAFDVILHDILVLRLQ